MKICAIICEYNPFHNGHLYQINAARAITNADAVLCIMSGNFVQRGEAAIMDKFTRAKHAVLSGADIVLELPTVFATSNAELFAKGAIRVLSSIPQITSLCFGAENADKAAFLQAASLLNDEPKEVSETIKALTTQGMSYAKARAIAWQERIPEALLSSPNNILGVEYTKAILAAGANIDICPVQRIGGYKDESLRGEYASAAAIREAVNKKENVAAHLPEQTLLDLPQRIENNLDILEKYALLARPREEIAKICDCTEGLENAFKNAVEKEETLVETLTSARYTSSRIRRIALQNLLQVDERLLRECLCENLYLRVLAIKKKRSDLLSALSESNFPLLIRAHDDNALTDVSAVCYEKDLFAEKLYKLLYPNIKTQKDIFI